MSNTGVGVYLRTWLGLLALLAFNVALEFLVPGLFTPWLHPAIAAIQAALMMTMFMSARRGSAVLRLAAVAGFSWLFLMFALTFGDYASRFEDVAMARVKIPPHEPAPATGSNPLAAEPPRQEPERK